MTATSGTPTGTVQFVVDGSNFGSPVTLASGSATSGSTSTLTAGTHTVTASYTATGSFQNSSGTLSGGQVVNQASQTITFTTPAPSSAAYNTQFTVAATGGGSGNPVTFTSSGACTNSGATYTMTSGTGTCSVIANQAGNTNYSAAPQVTEFTTATQASQTITFTTPAPSSAVYNTQFTVAATGGGSGNPVTFTSSGACSNSGATYTMTSGTGTCSVIANQAGNTNYSAAPQVTEFTTATQAGQTITFTTPMLLASATYGTQFTVAATGGGSGNPVTFTSAGACSNSGATYTMTSGTGTCSVIANQAWQHQLLGRPAGYREHHRSCRLALTVTADQHRHHLRLPCSPVLSLHHDRLHRHRQPG